MTNAPVRPALGVVLLTSAMAGGLGWGIRGQYGHETGAMMAGLLVGLTIGLLFCHSWPPLPVARAVALITVAIGFGGSMTYAQTIGLTKDPPMAGNWPPLLWGLAGLAIKGGLWIGFGGAFLGMGLGGQRYRPWEMVALFVAMLGLMFIGIWILNRPFDPAHKILPRIYFSADWRWQPGATLKPRPENWGGLLFALIGLIFYLAYVRRDYLAVGLAGWAVLGGAIGFPAGQMVQAFRAWNPGLFQSGLLARVDPVINWWNMMETCFGAIFAAVLAFGVWKNQSRLSFCDQSRSIATPAQNAAPVAEIGESILLLVYLPLLLCWEFFDVRFLSALAEPGISMGLLPIVGIMLGRWWPFWIVGPVTLIPIAGKTLRQLVYKEHVVDPSVGWTLYIALPVVAAVAAAVWFKRRSEVVNATAETAFLGPALLLNGWLYFALNFAFFRLPWPWEKWTARTPNAAIYLVCALGLSWLALRPRVARWHQAGARRDSPARDPRLP